MRASSYDVMLHRDSRFWEVIAKRNEAHSKDEAVSQDPMYGHTVGRRRDFGGTKKTDNEGEKPQSAALQTFSIGNEFDFLPSDDPKPAAVKPPPTPKKDSLMEALMGALNEDGEAETETIVFHTTSGEDSEQKASSAPPSIGVPTTSMVTGAQATAAAESNPSETPASGATSTAGSENKSAGDDDTDAILADANMNLDEDMEALFGGDDLLDTDIDAELEDLENFLSQK